MEKFREIDIRPLKKISDLKFNLIKKVEVGNIERNTEVDKQLNRILDYVYKNSEISFIGVEKDGYNYLSNQVKSSSNRKKIYTFPELDPISIYYNIANENLEKSAILKNKIISREQNFDTEEDFQLFAEYFSLTSQGIVFLTTTVEGFINQFFEDKEYVINEKTMTKKDLEWSKLEEKLNVIIPTILGVNFGKLHNEEYQLIVNSNLLRNDLIHLKKTENGNNTWYQEVLKKIIDYKHHKNSEAVFKLLDTLKTNYFEIKNNGRQ